jgi:hypothetical protein
VWHASVSSHTPVQSLKVAFAALYGVGDRALGEWRERGSGAIAHVRRRLSASEAALVNPLRDIRGTPEQAQRIAALLRDAPHLARYINSFRM